MIFITWFFITKYDAHPGVHSKAGQCVYPYPSTSPITACLFYLQAIGRYSKMSYSDYEDDSEAEIEPLTDESVVTVFINACKYG